MGTIIITDIFDLKSSDDILYKLKKEINWNIIN
jgi:hypothetical protein